VIFARSHNDLFTRERGRLVQLIADQATIH
jgi:hypothetical protein